LLGIKFCFEYKTAKLQWTAKDVDTKDKLVLMYILGQTNPPTEKAGVNQEAITLDVNIVAQKSIIGKLLLKMTKEGNHFKLGSLEQIKDSHN
jgi:hypothetical protein